MTQTWWLSFCDGDKPEGEQFLGVAIVDVTEDDANTVHDLVTRRRAMHGLPPAERGVEWMAAAVERSHFTGCNPGGEVACLRIDEAPEFAAHDATLPRNRLLSKSELEALGHGPIRQPDVQP